MSQADGKHVCRQTLGTVGSGAEEGNMLLLTVVSFFVGLIARITGFVRTPKTSPSNDHPRLLDTFLNHLGTIGTPNWSEKIKGKIKKKEVGHSYGPSVGSECSCLEKGKTNTAGGDSGKCLHVEFLFLLIFAEETVELLLCLTTSFMGGRQSDTHPALQDTLNNTLHCTLYSMM